MLRNDLFVDLSDEQQELVAGGRSYSGGSVPNIFQLGKSSFDQNLTAFKVLKTQQTAAGPHGAMTLNSDLVAVEKLNIHSDAFAIDKIGGGYGYARKKRSY